MSNNEKAVNKLFKEIEDHIQDFQPETISELDLMIQEFRKITQKLEALKAGWLLGELATKIKEEKLDMPIQEVLESLRVTKRNFSLDLNLLEIWEQEKSFYKRFGMSAFDAGYLGKV